MVYKKEQLLVTVWDMFCNKFYVLINALLVFLLFCYPISDDSIEHGLAFTNIANHFLVSLKYITWLINRLCIQSISLFKSDKWYIE
uniref:Uncharacterized protein n=1 Tax=Heterorhabditis bacteriophora TaxID=37862 RepID=A0A1I7WLU9_HETBA